MEDEEDEHLPHCCETPLRNKSPENRDASRREVGQSTNRHGHFEDRSTQTATSVQNSGRAGDMAPFQRSVAETSSTPCGNVNARTAFRANCGIGGLASITAAPGAPEEPRALFHGNAGFRAHFPALFETDPDGAPNTERRAVDEMRQEEKEDESVEGISVEIQIGRKLREMGDQFQQEHLQLFTQHHRGQLGWFHLVTSLYNFLFPQGGPQNARAQR